MQSVEARLLTYVLNSLWQVPLIFAAAWLAARAARRAGAAFHHRLWVSALLTEIFLPACSVPPVSTLRALQHWLLSGRETTLHHGAQVTVLMGPAQAEGALQLPPALLSAVALLYVGTVLYFAARLSLGLYRTASLRHRAEPLRLTGYAGQSYQRYARLFDVKDAVAATSSEIASPITLGIRARLLLLPAQIDADLLGEDVDAIFAHEFAHMRRRDFAKNLAYEALSLPAAFHPLLWLTRTHVAESRELVCDEMAANFVAGRQRYARSLLRLASKFSELSLATTPHAIGIFDAKHFKNFERRIMNLTQNHIELRGLRRLATASACIAIGLGTCASALALRMSVVAPTLEAGNAQSTEAGAMPQISGHLMAGNRLTFVRPIYPQAAKEAKLDGTVVLRAVISKQGIIEKLDVVSGPTEFQRSAIDAVRQWTYKPYLLNGNPTAVDTTITVTYSLQK